MQLSKDDKIDLIVTIQTLVENVRLTTSDGRIDTKTTQRLYLLKDRLEKSVVEDLRAEKLDKQLPAR